MNKCVLLCCWKVCCFLCNNVCTIQPCVCPCFLLAKQKHSMPDICNHESSDKSGHLFYAWFCVLSVQFTELFYSLSVSVKVGALVGNSVAEVVSRVMTRTGSYVCLPANFFWQKYWVWEHTVWWWQGPVHLFACASRPLQLLNVMVLLHSEGVPCGQVDCWLCHGNQPDYLTW